jgi:aldehyde dehydrogenase (NAD+)
MKLAGQDVRARLRDGRLFREACYINGAWTPADSGATIPVDNPATGEIIGTVPNAGRAETERAIDAAAAAFPAWRARTAKDRAAILRRWFDLLVEHQDDLATLMTLEQGKPLTEARTEVLYGASFIEWFAEEGKRAYGDVIPSHAADKRIVVLKEPIGVVGCITPWNYPLHQVVCKIAPALAAGCTVVLKPAELAPLSAFFLAEAAHEIGLPAGVFNVVSGSGRVVGEAIVAHPDVDMVSFTGSLAAGRRIASVAGDGIKKVCLELGGKSAFVVLDDAPFEKAIPAGVNNCMQNSGQTCSAWTRMLVPRARHDEAVEMAKAQLAKLTLGDPFDKNTRLGPLASASQRDSVLEYIEKGKQEGAMVVAGGGKPAHLPKGYYVEPTIFANVDNTMTVAQEEIFGPVLSIIPYDSEQEAIAIANDSPYGLAGGVWAGTQERALEVAKQMRTGQVDVNGGRFNALAPFGGYKKSGIGREIGPLAIEEFFQLKSIQR